MTIGATISEITVDGNGATTSFAYPFLIPASSDAVIIFTSATGVQTALLTSQYTISGIGLPTGGTVTYPLSGSPIPAGASLTIQRSLPLVQTTSLSNQGPTFAAIESALDYLTMLIQQIGGASTHAITGNVADPAGLNYEAPPVQARALQLLGFDSAGNVIAARPSSALVSSAMQPVVAAASTALGLAAMGAILPLGNVATLQAYRSAAPVPPVVYLEGATTFADGGEGPFVYVASDATSPDNGWTIIVDGLGRRWHRGSPSASPQIATQTGTNYTYTAASNGQMVARGNGGALMVDTLPGTGSGVMPNRWTCRILNNDATAMLVVLAGSGGSILRPSGGLLYLGPGQSALVISNGAQYVVQQAPTRAQCAAALTVYAAPGGSNSNHGLSAASPFATVQNAANVVYQAFDCNGFMPTISLAAGTFTAGQPGVLSLIGAPVGSGQITLTGATGEPTDVVLNATNASAIIAGIGVVLNVVKLTVQATGTSTPFLSSGVGLSAYNGSEINFNDLAFGACATAQIESTAGATVNSLGNVYRIIGSSPFHIAAAQCGVVITANSTVVLVGTSAFTAFVAVDSASVCYSPSMQFTGPSATGKRYALTSLGIIETNGGGATYFPGNAGGTNDGTGVYT